MSLNQNTEFDVSTPTTGGNGAKLPPIEIHLDWWSYLNYAWIILYAVVIWMIAYRKSAAKWFMIVIFALNLVQSITQTLLKYIVPTTEFEITSLLPAISSIVISVVWIIATVFLLRSKAVKERLNQKLFVDISSSALAGEIETDNALFRKNIHTIYFWRNLIIYFTVFSFIGHWIEFGYCLFLKYAGGPYEPDAKLWFNLLDPYVIYGYGLLLAILVVTPFKIWVQKYFKFTIIPVLITGVFGGFICVILEFIEGMMINQNYQYWDYRDLPFNFMGQVCLQNGIAFAVCISVITWTVYPQVNKAMLKLPQSVLNLIFIISLVSFSIAYCFYEIKL